MNFTFVTLILQLYNSTLEPRGGNSREDAAVKK